VPCLYSVAYNRTSTFFTAMFTFLAFPVWTFAHTAGLACATHFRDIMLCRKDGYVE
jgi:hypothetical protein